MATPLIQQPPPVTETQQPYNSSSTSHASFGPVIAVLLEILILGIVAGTMARLCIGRKFIGEGEYESEGWIERKCPSCVDSRIYSPQPMANSSVPTSNPHHLGYDIFFCLVLAATSV
ncbi:hypothetical protein PVK06_008573 [Gossypium arboreum]|uniref:Uncharacterized protein n=1 Tax=Gossypium arboreum TaxID=29729 RepID=A0ABR0QKB5_GOSAR|nr:hypothetical protein PVK06_008573 [Gossypium arboreum]